MAEKTEKTNRITDARKIADPAKLTVREMKAAVCAAWGISFNAENMLIAEDYLIRLGYGKLRATTKWARENEPKAARKPKARKPKAAATIVA